jgi:hypothetical protein
MRMRYGLDAMLPIDAFKPRMGFSLFGGGMTLHGDSPSPPPPAGPTQTTVQNTNIPEYAQPYVENMLNAAQAQIYNKDMTGFNPYQAYSGMNEQDLKNAQQAVAGFSPLQQQAQSSAANLQMPGQYGAATGAAGLGTGQALTAGDRYSSMATNPSAMGAYMNPYLNAALQPQLAEIGRQYDITGTQEMGNATRAGAFGGNREALMAAENQRNKNTAMNQAIGQGYNQAFQQAQQAQQFGANLGLQGAQAGIQGAGQLANIGGQQLAAQQGIIGTQAQQGALQQQNQQNVINQGIQNYATAQQYPYLQLGTLNSMLRGLPMQQGSTQMYQAAPNQVSQLAGLGTAGLGAAAMYNASKGASGGSAKDIAGYAPGGAIPMKSYSDDQLKQVQKSNYTDPIDKLYANGLQIDHGHMRGNPEATKLISQASQGMPPAQQMAQMPQTRTGLGSISTGDMVPQTFASGGIMAFADEGEVPPAKANPVDDALAMYADKSGKVDLNKAALALLGQAKSGKDAITPEREEIMKNIEDQKKMTGARTLTRFGLDLMRQPSQYGLTNFGTAGINTLNTYEKEQAAENELRRGLAKLDAEGATKDDARRLQLAGTLLQIQANRDMKMAALANAPSGEDRALNRAMTLVNNDPLIKKYIAQQKNYDEKDPQYQVIEQRIAERQNQIYNTAGVKVPEVTPSKIPDYVAPEKPGYFSGLFGSSKPAAGPKVVPFNQLPT